MRLRPLMRIAVCQAAAMAGLVAFLLIIGRSAQTVREPPRQARKAADAALFASALEPPPVEREVPALPEHVRVEEPVPVPVEPPERLRTEERQAETAQAPPKIPEPPQAEAAPPPPRPSELPRAEPVQQQPQHPAPPSYPPETTAEAPPPERFRPPTSASAEGPPPPEPLPVEVRTASPVAETVTVPAKEMPLAYLTKFQGVGEFHSFLNTLPRNPDREGRTMCLIRIEGLPRSTEQLRRLLESYHMEPFLFNPSKFSYVIMGDLQILRDQASVAAYISSVGRYLREEVPNEAYDAVRRELVRRARSSPAIGREITEPAEFACMEMGLASPYLARFLRKLEEDTASQVSELTGRPVAVRDIARIDCRFRDVNGALVLLPWRAYLGSDPSGSPVDLWRGK